MASLHTHLTSPHHGRLSFNHRCPHCRQQRVLGTLATGPLVSMRARAAGALSVIAFAPAVFATPAALAQGGPETSVGTSDPTSGGDDADDPNWSPPSVPNSKPLHDGGGVIDTDSPTNDGEGDPLDQDNDGDDPGGHNAAPAPVDPPAPAPADTLGSVAEDPVSDQSEPQVAPPVPPAAAAPATPPPPAPVAPSAASPKAKPPAPDKHARAQHRREHQDSDDAQPAAAARSGGVATSTTAAPSAPAPIDASPAPVGSSPSGSPASSAPVSGDSYTVRSGDSLWAIASRIAGSDASAAQVASLVHDLWSKNSSRIASGSPDMLAVGTVLELP